MAKKSQIDEKKSQIISRRKSFVFCDDHGIFRTHVINTFLRRIFPTSLTGDVISEIAEDDWERGWEPPEIAVIIIVEPTFQSFYGLHGHMSTVTDE